MNAKLKYLVREVTKIFEALPKDYYPPLGYDPYEEDCCGSHKVFEVTNSGLGVSLEFIDGNKVFFDDNGELCFSRKGHEV